MRRLIALFVLGCVVSCTAFGAETMADENVSGNEAPCRSKTIRWGGYSALPKPETIAKKLGDMPLSDEQLAEIKTLREETLAKVKEWGARPEVMDALEELARTRRGQDRNAFKAAEERLAELGDGSEFITYYQYRLGKILSADQMARLFPPRKGTQKAKAKE